ncbi:MAG: Ig-like domain-containing protein [Lachnospiraceae bacterium]|nr:Ig-like domain-containing protein [Lachnospiraceae bacterium]
MYVKSIFKNRTFIWSRSHETLVKKKQLSNAHATEFRYASADNAIAKVDKKGNVTGVAKGSTKIYVYSRNGLAKAVKVTVK